MPRNSSGVYTLPAGNPVVPNTLIETTWANPTMADIGSSITDSLDRQGRGSMLAPLKLTDGTPVAPSLSFSSESTTGMYRPASGTIGLTIAGVLKASLTATAFTLAAGVAFALPGPITVAGGTAAAPAYSFTGDTNTGLSAQVADTLILSTAGLARVTAGPAGAIAIAAPTAGTALTVNALATNYGLQVLGDYSGQFAASINSSGGATNGRVGLEFVRTGGTGKSWVIGNDTDGGSANNFQIRDLTRAVVALAVGTNGNVTITAPVSGTALSLTGVAANNQVIAVASPAGASAFIDLAGNGQTTNTTSVTIGQDSTGDATIFQRANRQFYLGTNGNVRLTVSAAGVVGINAPSAGTYALDIAGNVSLNAATSVLDFTSSAANPAQINSFHAGDLELVTRNAAAGVRLYRANGVMAYTISSTGAHTIATPTSGNTLSLGAVAGSRALTCTNSLSGSSLIAAFENTANTASSTTQLFLSVGGSSAADAFVRMDVSAVQSWSMGLDNSDSDTFKISASTDPSAGSSWFNITTDGRLYGIALHNNAGAVTGTTNQYIASGTYTPTLSNAANVAASGVAANAFNWVRVGNVVHVAGNCTIDPTAGATNTALDITAPIASAMTAGGAGTGVRATGTTTCIAGAVALTAANQVRYSFFCDADAANRDHYIVFQYVIN